MRSSRKIWESIGNKENAKNDKKETEYLTILEEISNEFRTIDPGLIQRMKEASILAAIKYDGSKITYHLDMARNIYINDDTEYQKIFNPLTAPIDFRLYHLYRVGYYSSCLTYF